MKHPYKRILKTGWVNFTRNSYLSFGTTGVMAISLVLFMALLALQFLTSQVVNSLEQKVDISAYFKTDAPEDQILQIKSDLEKLPEIQQVDYISREKALADFKQKHAGDQLIQDSLEQLDSNPLNALLNIKARDSSQYASITQFLENNKFRSSIEKINFYENKDVIERIRTVSSSIGNWGLISTIALSLIAVLITFNTIRLTIYNQKKEIEIMKLVGASSSQIRGPYLIEGALYGIFAALIAMFVFYPGVYFVSDKIAAFTSANLLAYFIHGIPEISVMTIGLGLILGVFSSYIAIHRYLKI